MKTLKPIAVLLGILIATVGLSVNAKTASRAMLPALELQNLFGEKPVLLKAGRNNLLFVTFFENKCRWCLRQMNTYQDFQSEIKASFIMVGVGDSKIELRHWAKRAGTSLPVAYASDELLSLVGAPQVTPMTLIFDPQGGFITKVTGYIKAKNLEQLAAQFSAEKVVAIDKDI